MSYSTWQEALKGLVMEKGLELTDLGAISRDANRDLAPAGADDFLEEADEFPFEDERTINELCDEIIALRLEIRRLKIAAAEIEA